MRQDEHGWDPKGPPALLDYRASIDDQGRSRLGSRRLHAERPMRRSGVTLLAATLANLPKFGPPAHPAQHRARRPVSLPNNKLTAHWLVDHAAARRVDPCAGRMQNTFGNESFLDEIAAATNVDPFEIRSDTSPIARDSNSGAPAAVRQVGAARSRRATPAPSRAGAACRMRSTSWYARTSASSPT
jgi:hypothetical protein